MADFPPLNPGEVELQPSDELLLRNVHPEFYDPENDLVTSQAFRLNSNDDGCLSVIRRSQVSPFDAHFEYSTSLGLPSIGVWAVSADEVADEGARSIDDSAAPVLQGHQRPSGHAYIDYRDLEGRPRPENKRGKQFSKIASSRGPLYFDRR